MPTDTNGSSRFNANENNKEGDHRDVKFGNALGIPASWHHYGIPS